MKKKQILKLFFLIYIVVSLFFCNPGNETETEPKPEPLPIQCETRGTWLWASSIDSSEKRTFVLEKIIEANLNTVFVSIPPIEGNHGYGKTDDFLDFITDAKALGLSVHAWMLNGRRKGRNTEADYRDSNEQDAQVNWAMSIMRNYGNYLNGIHLDYIRYINYEDVNNNFKMDAVTETISKIYNSLLTNYPDKYLTATSFITSAHKDENGSPSQWFINWRNSNTNSIYSYDKVPSFMRVQQDPIEWIKKDIVSGVMPMQYTTDDGIWNQDVELFKSFNSSYNNDPSKIFMGLGWIEKTSPNSTRGYNAAGVVRKIKYGRSLGMKGFVIFILFNHGYDDSPLVNALTVDSNTNNNEAPFKSSVPSCLD